MKNPFNYILLICLVFCFVTIGAAQSTSPQPSPKATPPPAATKLERTSKFDGNVEFPEIDGWKLSGKQKYPSEALGYSVNYESPTGGRVTVYVYNGGRKSIPNSLTGIVEEEMDRAKNDIKAAVDAGAYESAKLIKSEPITLGGTTGNVKALYSGYDLVARGNKLHSEIYLFPYQDHFVKLRATRLKSNEKTSAFDTLLSEIDALFMK